MDKNIKQNETKQRNATQRKAKLNKAKQRLTKPSKAKTQAAPVGSWFNLVGLQQVSVALRGARQLVLVHRVVHLRLCRSESTTKKQTQTRKRSQRKASQKTTRTVCVTS